MIASSPGDPIWLREGILVISEPQTSGIPLGVVLNKPCRGIFLERKTFNSIAYIKAYVDDVGERYIQEDEVLDLKRG